MDADVNIVEVVQHAFHLYDDLQPDVNLNNATGVHDDGAKDLNPMSEGALVGEDVESDLPEQGMDPPPRVVHVQPM
jgi:hypothetical protein